MAISILEHPKALILDLRVDRLNHRSTMRMLPPSSRITGRKVRLQLSKLKFVEPFGLVFLYFYVRRLIEMGAEELYLDLGRCQARAYIERMNVCDLLRNMDPRVRVPHRLPFRRNQLRDRLIELNTYTIDEVNDVEGERLAEDLLDLIVHGREEFKDRTEELQLCLQEVISNVTVHSGRNEVVVAAQRYDTAIYLAFGDAGFGIPNRLRKSGLWGQREDHHAIEHALKEKVSTRAGLGGMGLTMITEVVKERAGHLAIRSGRGHVVVTRDGVARWGKCHPLPGTLVEVQI